jgi:hypothetical protein
VDREGSRDMDVIFSLLGSYVKFGWNSCVCILCVRVCIRTPSCVLSLPRNTYTYYKKSAVTYPSTESIFRTGFKWICKDRHPNRFWFLHVSHNIWKGWVKPWTTPEIKSAGAVHHSRSAKCHLEGLSMPFRFCGYGYTLKFRVFTLSASYIPKPAAIPNGRSRSWKFFCRGGSSHRPPSFHGQLLISPASTNKLPHQIIEIISPAKFE